MVRGRGTERREERKIRGINCSTLLFSTVLLLILGTNYQIASKWELR
jgi:hypothetical protein